MNDEGEPSGPSVRAPRQIVCAPGTAEEVRRQVDAAGLQLPRSWRSPFARMAAATRTGWPSSTTRTVPSRWHREGSGAGAAVRHAGVREPRRLSVQGVRGGRRRDQHHPPVASRFTRREEELSAKGQGVGAGEREAGAAAAKDTATRQGAKLARGRASEGDGTGGSPERAGDDGYDQDESGGEGESEDDESGLYSFTGAQQIPRVSCFKGELTTVKPAGATG